jgi:hypothetical protein
MSSLNPLLLLLFKVFPQDLPTTLVATIRVCGGIFDHRDYPFCFRRQSPERLALSCITFALDSWSSRIRRAR